jgi:hypothetical protein
LDSRGSEFVDFSDFESVRTTLPIFFQIAFLVLLGEGVSSVDGDACILFEPSRSGSFAFWFISNDCIAFAECVAVSSALAGEDMMASSGIKNEDPSIALLWSS